MKPVVSVFVRPVVPGRVKTRLGRALPAAAVARLYGAFIQDCAAHVATTGYVGALWIAGDPDHACFDALAAGRAWATWPRLRQPEADLGTRQRAALAWGLARGDRALAVGSDTPTLPSGLLAAACAALERADLVLGPAADGGYYLIGVRDRLAPDLLRDVRWSTRHTLGDTLASARACGYRPCLLTPFYDVDDPGDLALLRMHLELDPTAAPSTREVLATISTCVR